MKLLFSDLVLIFFSGIRQYENTSEWDEGGGGAGLVGVGVVLLLAGVGGSFDS